MFERDLGPREIELLEGAARFVEAKHTDQKAHDYGHVLTVVDYAVRIGRAMEEGVDPFVLVCGAFFHDLGWVGADSGVKHGLRGAMLTEEYLASTWVPEETRRRVRDVVVRHTITSDLAPERPEEKVVWDADGLAGLGLLGVLRGIISGVGSSQEIVRAALRYAGKPLDRLHYDESRRIGRELQEETDRMLRRFRHALDERERQVAALTLPSGG